MFAHHQHLVLRVVLQPPQHLTAAFSTTGPSSCAQKEPCHCTWSADFLGVWGRTAGEGPVDRHPRAHLVLACLELLVTALVGVPNDPKLQQLRPAQDANAGRSNDTA